MVQVTGVVPNAPALLLTVPAGLPYPVTPASALLLLLPKNVVPPDPRDATDTLVPPAKRNPSRTSLRPSVPPFVSSVADVMAPFTLDVEVLSKSTHRMLYGSAAAVVQLKKPLNVNTALVIVLFPKLIPSSCHV